MPIVRTISPSNALVAINGVGTGDMSEVTAAIVDELEGGPDATRTLNSISDLVAVNGKRTLGPFAKAAKAVLDALEGGATLVLTYNPAGVLVGVNGVALSGQAAAIMQVIVTEVTSVTVDGPLNYKMPITPTEWSAAGLPVPAYLYRGQEASGNLVESMVGQFSLVAAATPEYQQTLPGWNLKFLKLTNTATEGFSAQANELWDTNVQSVVYTTYFQLTGLPAALSVLCMLAGAGGYVSINPSGILQLRNSGVATGTYNYDDGQLHFVRVGYRLDASVPGHTGAGVWKVWTDKETLTGTWELLPADIKGIGGCGVFTPPPVLLGPQEVHVGTDAETLIAGGVADMVSRGWTVA